MVRLSVHKEATNSNHQITRFNSKVTYVRQKVKCKGYTFLASVVSGILTSDVTDAGKVDSSDITRRFIVHDCSI